MSSVVPVLHLYQNVNGEVLQHAHPALKQTAAEIAAGVTPVNYAYEPGDVRRFCATDGASDQATGLNAAFSVGGDIRIPAPFTFRAASANITMAANTRLTIERGATLWLDTTRLTAYRVNDIYIGGGGRIYSTSLNTTDAYPSGWNCRGTVEFGGTDASNSQRFHMENIKVEGDWSGTPGALTIDPVDKRRGVFFTNAQNVKVNNCVIFGIVGETIFLNTTTAAPNDYDFLITENTIHHCNHDAISQAGLYVYTFRCINNTMYNCLNGIETNAGEVRGNYAFNMAGAGYSCGGNGNELNGSPLPFNLINGLPPSSRED